MVHKDEATNFGANIENANAFKSFKYKAKLLKDTKSNLIEIKLIES